MQLLTHTDAFQSQDNSSVEPLHWAHSGLDVQRPHILPVLLQQGDEKVHGEMNILDKIVLGHTHVADSNRQTEHLLHLELYGGFKVKDLGIKVIRVSHQRGELSCLVEAWAQKPWDLLDQSVRGKEGVILLGQTLNLLLVLVQLLQVISGHEVDALGLSLITMLLISQQANLELLAGHMLQPLLSTWYIQFVHCGLP